MTCSGYAIHCDTGSGSRIASVFGTCSPTTMCSDEKTRNPIRNEVKCSAVLGHAERHENRREQRRHGRLADPAETERRHRDAELTAGEIGLDVAQHPLHAAARRSGSPPPCALTRKPRLLTSANSAATKNALAASRNTASSRLMMVEVIVVATLSGRMLMRTASARGRRAPAPGSTSGATKACPMPRTRMKVSLPRFTFLSCAIRSISASRIGRARRARRGCWVGSPTAARWRDRAVGLGLRQQAEAGRKTRTRRRCRARPLRRAAACRRSPPPPRTRGRRCGRDSSSARSPVSRSSRATIAALPRHAIAIACSRAGPPANTSCQFASSQAKKPASPSRPNFASSA